MTKADVISKISEQTGIDKNDVSAAVEAFFTVVKESMEDGDNIYIRGFGSFNLNYRPPRLGRNPKTGSKVQVPAKHVPHFKAGKELRDRVDAA